MSKKTFTVVFIMVTIIAVAGLSYSKMQQSSNKTASPSPSVNPLFTQAQPPKRYAQFPGELLPEKLTKKKAVIQTDKGNIEFEIYPEATKAASNFVFLTEDKFYDGLTFHRVEPEFVIQGGDPSGNGTGGPGYQFADEPVTKPYLRGIVAMANAGPNTNGSQFFIMLEDNLKLPPRYTIFGKVVKGQEVVGKIQVGDIMRKVTIEPL